MRPIDRNAPNAYQLSQQREAQVNAVYNRLASGRLQPLPGDADRVVKGKMGALNALSDARNPKIGLAGARDAQGEYVGFLSYKVGRGEVEIENLGTDGTTPGSGRALFNQVLRVANEEGRGLVVAPVPDAVGFYQRMGMRSASEGALELSKDEVRSLWRGLNL
jgi:hypothetical protein